MGTSSVRGTAEGSAIVTNETGLFAGRVLGWKRSKFMPSCHKSPPQVDIHEPERSRSHFTTNESWMLALERCSVLCGLCSVYTQQRAVSRRKLPYRDI